MEKQHCTAFSITLQSQKNAKPKSLSCQWCFKRIPGLKGERKISCSSFICFVLLGFFLEQLCNQGKAWELQLCWALQARTTGECPMASPHWDGQRPLGLEGWARSQGAFLSNTYVLLPGQKGVKGCPPAPRFREILRKKVCLFLQEIKRHKGRCLCYFSCRKKLYFVLLGHCLWLSKKCPEEKGQWRLWGGSMLRFPRFS